MAQQIDFSNLYSPNYPNREDERFQMPDLPSFEPIAGGDFDNNYGVTSNSSISPTANNNVSAGGGFKWFGKGGALIPGLNALTGLFTAGTALKSLREEKRANRFNMNLARGNFANQAKLTNAQIQDHARAVARQRGLRGSQLTDYVSGQTEERQVQGAV